MNSCTQCSDVMSSLCPSSCNGIVKLKHCNTRLHAVRITDWRTSLKQNICIRQEMSLSIWTCKNKIFISSVAPPCICGPKLKNLRNSAFKGGAQNQDSSAESNGSKISQDSVRLIENDKATSETPVPFSCNSEVNERDAKSSAILKLFTKWLTSLRSQPRNKVVNGILNDESPIEVSESSQETQKREGSHILKVAWSHFLNLDATIKVPLIMFISLYLTINVRYGSEVSKELIPLWVFGPFIVALYVKMMQKLFALYVFCFTQTFELIKNLPVYCDLASNYVKHGKLKQDIQAHFVQPVVRIKNLNYKALSRRKWKKFEEWSIEKYLDFLESIWPYYCRTVRFLKRANLI